MFSCIKMSVTNTRCDVFRTSTERDKEFHRELRFQETRTKTVCPADSVIREQQLHAAQVHYGKRHGSASARSADRVQELWCSRFQGLLPYTC